MKKKIYFLLFIISFGTNFFFSQHENDNWLFGNNKWFFDNSVPNGFSHTTNLNPYIRYQSSVISDKNTGDLLFFSNGYNIYNKNSVIMDNGNDLFGTPVNLPFQSIGNPSDQSSIILPLPNSNSLYYVFYIHGDRRIDDQDIVSPYSSYSYGLRYAIVDISLNGGLGKVISKNNILFTNSPTNALTSTFASDGNSYWIVTANNGNFLSYKLSGSGLNTTPVVSSGAIYGGFIKISPNAKKLLSRVNSLTGGGVFLANFNNTTGIVNNQMNIIPVSNLSYYYSDASNTPNSAEFSPDSNIVYFIGAESCLCLYPDPIIGYSGLAMYNISTGSLVGVNNTSSTHYDFSLMRSTASLQRAKDGKIYLIQNIKRQANSSNISKVDFNSNTIPSNPSYEWKVINTPNVWSPTLNPLSSITPAINTRNGFSFPQLIPSLDNTCPDILNITQQITTSQNFQAGQFINASSAINDDLIVNYKAGQNVILLPGFHVKATRGSLFRAYIGLCDGTIENFAKINNIFVDSDKKEISKSLLASDVKIYPNPASTFINIDSGNKEIISWELFDISGKIVLKGSTKQINVSSIPKANYLIKINTRNKQVTKKVIVN